MKVGEISENVDNDMNVRFKCKRRSSPIFGFFPRNAPLNSKACVPYRRLVPDTIFILGKTLFSGFKLAKINNNITRVRSL